MDDERGVEEDSNWEGISGKDNHKRKNLGEGRGVP